MNDATQWIWAAEPIIDKDFIDFKDGFDLSLLDESGKFIDYIQVGNYSGQGFPIPAPDQCSYGDLAYVFPIPNEITNGTKVLLRKPDGTGEWLESKNLNEYPPTPGGGNDGSSGASLVTEYRLEEILWDGSIGEVKDYSGNDINGASVNGASTDTISPALDGDPGTCGYGDFDGIDDYLAIPDNDMLDISDDLTITAWIYPTKAGQQVIVSKARRASGSNNYQLQLGAANTLLFQYRSGGADKYVSTSTPISMNTWSHVTVTYTDGLQRFYINGIETDTGNNTGVLDTNNAALDIGAERIFDSSVDGIFGFEGRIDEVRVYDGALTGAEVRAVAIETHPCETSTLLALHRFEQSDFSTQIDDTSGEDNHATVLPYGNSVSNGKYCRGFESDGWNQDNQISDGFRSNLAIDNDVGLQGTISFWFNSTIDWDRGQERVLFDASIGDSISDKYFVFEIQQDGRLKFAFEDSSDDDFTVIEPSTSRISDTWYYLTVTWDYTNDSFAIYVDGALQQQVTRNTNGAMGPLNQVVFGDNSSQYTQTGNSNIASPVSSRGDFDEVRVYSRVLTQTEIQTDMNDDNGCAVELIAYYQMDELAWSGADDEILNELGSLHGKASGATTDRIDPAREFNPGTCGYGEFVQNDKQYAEIPYSDTLNPDGSFSIAFWARVDGKAGTYRSPITSRWENVNASQRQGYNLYASSSNQWQFWTGEGLGSWDVLTGPSVLIGEWTHISITFEATSSVSHANGNIHTGTKTMYIDGVFSSSKQGNYQANTTNPFYIGRGGNGAQSPNYFFEGAIDEVKVYNGALSSSEIYDVFLETHPCDSFVDHFQIDTKDQVGITCQADEVIVKACADSSCSTINPDAVDVNLFINNVEYKTVTVSGAEGTTTTYPHTTVGNALLSLDQTYKCTNTLGTEPCIVDFKDSGFLFSDIPTQISGKSSAVGFDATTLTLKAIETDNNTGACVGSFPDGGDVQIDLSYSCDDGSCSEPIILTNNSINASVSQILTPYPLRFGNDSTATFAINYPDAGQLILNAEANVKIKDSAGNDVLDGDGNPTYKNLVGISESFVERPFGFYINVLNNPEAESAGDAVFKKAGEDFTVELSAVVWQSADDSDNDGVPDLGSDLSDNDITVGFGHESIAETAIIDRGLVAPLPGTLGELVSGEFTFTNGFASDAGISYSEVGIINLTANLSGNSYLGASDVQGNEPYVGRFYPDHFIQTIESGKQGSLIANHNPAASCTMLDWVYTGQITDSRGSIQYLIEPVLTITANNADGVKTLNYIDDFAKMAYLNTDVNNKITFSPPVTKHANLLPLQGDVSGIGTITVQSGGLLTYQLPSEHHYVYTRNSTSKVAPFKANFELPFDEFKDSDNVTFKVSSGSTHYFQNPHFYQLDAIPPDVTAFDNSVEVRFGRWVLENSYGPETSNLPVTMFTQYFDGTGSPDFINNDKESCLIPTVGIKDPLGDIGDGGMALWDYRLVDLDSGDSLTPADTDASVEDVNKTFVSGIYRWLLFSAPGNNKQGSLEVEYQVPPWLQYDWNGDTNFINNPTATLTFGIYRGNDRIIYQREIEKRN
jgi:MSHA biogenesis protein MshQ